MKSVSVFFTLVLLITFTSLSTAQIDWTKYEGNPLFGPGAPGTWSDYSLFPFCILFDGNTYHMWYSGHDSSKVRIGYATSTDEITWTPYAGNPVMDVGLAGSWEDEWVTNPYVLFNGSTYRMWYTGFDGTNARIGYATSPDGITWTRYAGNPVMDKGSTGSWMSKVVGAPCILYDRNTYHMWFHGWNAEGLGRIGYAISPDGISWTPSGNPVITPDAGAWDPQWVGAPDVIFDGEIYHMWYSGGNTTSYWRWRLGYATSLDGKAWTKYTGNPVLTPSAESWDSQWTGYCRVLWDVESFKFKMWYSGGDGDWYAKLGYATADTVTGIQDAMQSELPRNYMLIQNYPNPFNPLTTIEFSIPQAEFVSLKIYNLLGQKVLTLVSEKLRAGNYKYKWNASGYASGIYYFRIEVGDPARRTGGFQDFKKMILLR